MSAKDLPALAEMRLKIADLEKENLSLQNQVEILNNELSQKNMILKKTNSELSELQTQYKQALDKIVELSHKSGEKHMTSEEERIYRSQLAEQSVCISTLQDRLWDAEHQKKLAMLNSSDSYQYDRNKHGNYNYHHGSFCDPIPNIEMAEKKMMKLHQKLSDYSKENEFYISELRKWTSYNLKIFNIVSDALNEYPGFPSEDLNGQRRITVQMIEKLASLRSDATKIYAKYQTIKGKYENAKEYLNRIEQKCARLSEVSQVRPTKRSRNINNDFDSETNINQHYYRKQYQNHMNCEKRTSRKENVNYGNSNYGNINYRNTNHQNANYEVSSDEESLEHYQNQQRNNQYEKNVKKSFNSRKYEFSDDDERCHSQPPYMFSDKIGQSDNSEHSYTHKLNHQRTEKSQKSKKLENKFDNDDYEISNDDENYLHTRKSLMVNNRNGMSFKDKRRIAPNTDPVLSKKLKNKFSHKIQGNDYNSDDVSRNVYFDETIHNRTEFEKNQFKDSYVKNKSRQINQASPSDDETYRNVGKGISRLTKITKKMKNDYYDFAKFTDGLKDDSYSIEELTKINASAA
ncbi:hypothetical protein TRFO_12645 [Tritrichomonas foetus]|uniref:Uncharacterized protein n=1 Tax=Tritrichomonas foetus TaxID=1144522 RepID=A0A1J4L132_9EUKA|nr:hypothetical protein TRFO_12645 [Tritrichomonas foetus]|eukprot:OHT17122.1 hypothetical protein TRFO_12645 [Tritrichomonas foetus]